MILQLTPTASVPVQGFGLTARAKSPLVVMVPKCSVAVPLLVTKTVFALPVFPRTTFPNVSEVGVRVTAGPPPAWFTVRLNVVVCVMLPDTPVTVTVDVPSVAVALAVKVSVLLVVAGFGLNAAVTPLGKPEALKVTLPLKPFCGVMVMVLVAVPPCATLTVFGLVLRLKLGEPPAQPVKANDAMLVCQLKVPLTFSY